MGNSAQDTDLVGIYILSKIGKNVSELGGGLYKDDVPFTIRHPCNCKVELNKNKVYIFLKSFELFITIEKEHESVIFHDVNLSLVTGKYEPYHKPNSYLKYINDEINHRGSVNDILFHISKWISNVSSNKYIFGRVL